MKQQPEAFVPSPPGTPDVLKRVLAHARRSAQDGLFPYEGQWLSKREIERRIRAKRLSGFVHVVEIGVLFVLTYLVAGLAWMLISLLNY